MVEKIRFVAEARRLRMLRKTTGEQIMPNGTVAITTPEVVYEFENGGLDLLPGQDPMPDGYNPETGKFELEQDAISWLRSTPEFAQGKVIEVLPEAPDPSPLFVEIGRLEAAGDLEALMEIGQVEHETWARPQVLAAARAAVEAVEAREPAKAGK